MEKKPLWSGPKKPTVNSGTQPNNSVQAKAKRGDKDGKKEFGRIDMTDPALFTSPYYYLRQNDVVYVEPNKAKKRNSRYSAAQQYTITVFSSILSAISVITTVILAITK